MPKKITTEEWIKRAIKIHGFLYDYSNTIYKGILNKINIKCYKHGIFNCNPNDHIFNKSGCPKCAGSGKYENPLEYFIERSKIIHNNKYDYSKFQYKKSKFKSIIICPFHGEFIMHPNSHLNGTECPKCSNKKGGNKRKFGKNKIIKKLKIIHNNKYEYDLNQEFLFNNSKIKIKCPVHGVFEQNLINHYYKGNGCEKCGNNRISKGEKAIESFLLKNKINHIREHTFDRCINPKTNRKLYFDFYIPHHDLCIEFDGKQHFYESEFFKYRSGDLEDLQKRDKIKENYCKKNNISLIRISYLNFSKINNILNILL